MKTSDKKSKETKPKYIKKRTVTVQYVKTKNK